MTGPVYVTEFFGDLRDPMVAHPTLDAALESLKQRFGVRVRNADGDAYWNAPDPEDDRIVIWEATPGEVCKAVWHFSGWHWASEADDLPGGPLPQGRLPGFRRSLYEVAMEDM